MAFPSPRLATLALLCLAGCRQDAAPAPADAGPAEPFHHAPIARRERTTLELDGHRLNDDYAWLRHKGAPEVEAYLQAENEWTDVVMAPTRPLQDALYAEMVARVQETDVSVPYLERGYFYSTRTEAGKQYPILSRWKGEKGASQLLLNLNELGKGEKFIGLDEFQVSGDNRWLAYSLDVTGFRDFTLSFKDLETGGQAPERVPHVSSAAWAADDKTVFYTVENDAKRSWRLYRHQVGTAPGKDPLVYEEPDEHFDLSVSRTRSGTWLVLMADSLTTSEARVLDARTPAGAWRVVLPRKHDVQYALDHRGGSFFLTINDKGRDPRLVEAPVDAPANFLRELVPLRAGAVLESAEVFQDFYVVHERVNGLPRLRVVEFPKGRESIVEVPDADFSAWGEGNVEFGAKAYRYVWESMITPTTVMERTVATGETRLLKRQPVPTYDAARYETARAFATAADGTKIPVSLAFKKGTPRDGSAPLYLRAYGSYGSSYDARFADTDVSLLDRGVVLAVAHVRGGGELGKAWHDAGRMMNKKTTFTDFIACAEWLIAERWTSRERLAINGASAGGLLMGAVLNLRPDLFKAAFVEVPFVDVVNTMLDESLPLTVPEFEEWGNPKDPAALEYLLGYSPYDNVAVKAYPAMLVRSAYNDSQVLYHEPAKWVAKLRAMKTDGHPLLLRMELDPAGHGGRSGRYDALHDEAFASAFVLTQLGLSK